MASFEPPKSRLFELFTLAQQNKQRQSDRAFERNLATQRNEREGQRFEFDVENEIRRRRDEDTAKMLEHLKVNPDAKFENLVQSAPNADRGLFEESKRAMKADRAVSLGIPGVDAKTGKPRQELNDQEQSVFGDRIGGLTQPLIDDGRFGEVRALLQQIEERRQLAKGETAKVIGGETRGEQRQIREGQRAEGRDIRSVNRRERADIRKQGRSQRTAEENSAVISMRDSIAGMVTGSVTADERDAGFQAAVREFGVEKAVALRQKAETLLAARIGEFRRLDRSPEGRREMDIRAQDRRELLEVQFGADSTDDIPDGMMRELVRNAAFVDPFEARFGTLNVLTAATPSEMTRAYNTRMAQADLYDSFDLMTGAFESMREAGETRGLKGAGPGVPNTIQDVLTFFGEGDPAVQLYKNATFEFISSLLRARQGSRPSDFDLRMYLSLAPTVQEVFSGTADAKIAALRNSLLVSVRNQEMGRKVLKIKQQPKTAEDRRLDAAWAPIIQKMDDGEVVSLKDLDKPMREAARWQATRGGKFTPPGVNPDVVDDEMADDLRKVME